MNRLIIISTPFEIMPLLTQLELPNITAGAILPGFDAENHLMITGVGTPSTMLFLAKVCSSVVYDEIVQIGFCGSFDKDVPLGTVLEVVTDSFADLGFDDMGKFLPLHTEMPDAIGAYGMMEGIRKTKLPAKRGVTVNTTSGSENRIRQVIETWNPDIETMEGAAAMLFCRENGIPFIHVRSVSNYVTPRNKSDWNMKLAAENLSGWLKEYLKITI